MLSRAVHHSSAPKLLPLGLAFAHLLSWSELEASDSFAARATPVEQLKVAKDFKVELLYTVPKEKEGSWVNLCVEPRGRLIVSDQYGGLYRVTPSAPGQPAGPAKVEPVPVDLGEAQGLVWAFDSLYVVVNRGRKYSSGLYRVRDTNGDDQLDEVQLLRPIDGSGEHGPHAVLLHPDGRSLVVVCGNHTRPLPFDTSRVPRAWGEDHLIPRMWDAGGHAVGILAPGGWIARTDPDGRQWELLSMGYRNQFDAAYNRDGELFTYDADMEWDLNTPWYRPTRVCHAVSGAEFGWRSGSGKWPAYYPDNLPSVVDVGPGSPTGVCFGYGARFPAQYQEALFICDWSYGKLYAVRLAPEGATYRGEVEEFVTGAPLPLTDVVANPADGALYFTIGGRKTQSALYRVVYTGRASTAPVEAAVQTAAAKLRRKLEAFHGRKDPAAVATAWPGLGHRDRFVRWAARVAIEHQDPATWQERALKERAPAAALGALLALVRVGDRSLQPRVLEALAKLSWSKLSKPQQLELLRIYGLAFIRMGAPDAATAANVAAILDAVYPAPSRALNAELSKLLVYLQAPSAARKTMALLAKAPTQEEQMDYAYALRVLKAGWTRPLQEDYFRWFLKAASYRGGHSFAGFLRNIKAEAVKNLDETARAELRPILEAEPEKKSPLEIFTAGLAGRKAHHPWTVEELAPALEAGLRRRNYQRGRELFGAVACAACHRFNNEGGAYGPDLTGAVGRFSPRDLLEAILEPSKEVSDQYAPVVVTPLEGEAVAGRIVNLFDDVLMVSPNLFDPDEIVKIDRKKIRSIEPSKVSLMPEGLLNVLEKDEILDLLAYLLSRGDPSHRMFK